MTEEYKNSDAFAADVDRKVESAKTDMHQEVRDLKSAAATMAEEYRGKAEQLLEDARDRAHTFQKDSEQYVRGNPTKTVFSALGIGFVLGLIFRR